MTELWTDFTDDGFMKLIVRDGPMIAATKLIKMFERTIKSQNRRYLRDKFCNDPVIHGEDVMQDTLIEVYKGALGVYDGVKKISSPLAWVCTISRRQCSKHIEECRFKYLLTDADDLLEKNVLSRKTASSFPDIFKNSPVENSYYKEELFHKIKLEFYSLPREQQIALVYFLRDYKHKEIALIMNISHANARKLVSRGMHGLKKYISKSGGENQ